MLDEAMAEVLDLGDRAALIAHLAADLRSWGYDLTDADVRVEPYCFDERIGWDTYIVTIRNKPVGDHLWFGDDLGPEFFGAVGFTNGPAETTVAQQEADASQ